MRDLMQSIEDKFFGEVLYAKETKKEEGIYYMAAP